MKKSTIVTLFLAFFLLIVLFCIGSIVIMKEPVIEVRHVEITGMTWSTMDFNVTFAITNPYPLGVTVAELTYTITAEKPDGQLLLVNGTTEEINEIKIARYSTTDITIPAQINNGEIVAAGIKLLADGDIEIIVAGDAKIDLKITQPRIPFSKHITITKEEILSKVTGADDLINEIRMAGINIALQFLLPSEKS